MRTFEALPKAPARRDFPDLRFDARRCRLDEFPCILALVDRVFGTRSGQAAYDWLYRGNPGVWRAAGASCSGRVATSFIAALGPVLQLVPLP